MNTELQSRISKARESALKNDFHYRELLDIAKDCITHNAKKELLHQILDIAHLSNVSISIYKSKQIDIWFNYILEIIKLSNFNVGCLLKQRSKSYKNKIAFHIIKKGHLLEITYSTLWEKVIEVGKGIHSFNYQKEKPIIGLLTHNQLNGVLVDLACLSFGVKVIPIPLNVTAEHASYIIEHSGISHLFIGGENGEKIWNEIKETHTIIDIHLSESSDKNNYNMNWNCFLNESDKVEDFDINAHIDNINMNAVQTIMYTSGTTANPKGIVFDQMNIMSKRFARALALPELNSKDVFLAYLPLFHTFGRYFEMLGSIFWGSSYCFAESPAFNSLLNDFKIVKPTIFISIPKRWVQLYEMLQNEIDLDSDRQEVIKKRLQKITGGNLKWGLSAAGFLDSDIFSFFQLYGINLLSGYGMTEATGGITMTPPNDYVTNSVGTSLPGIELKLEKDGELCLRGPYVTDTYYKEKNEEIFKDGWFHTEDIFEEKNGHYFIIDRKKDIYKNSRGQTIAPQKIENLFQDFDAIKSIFLVGDGKEFNTVLIYPDHKNSPLDLQISNNEEVRDFFSSMILSVNSFLSPFERIVNYAIINRNFSKEKGELTHKGTFVRNQILKNFNKIIDPLYEKNYVSLYHNSNEIRIPNWLTREIGTVKNNIIWNGKTLSITDQPKALVLNWSENSVQIGDYIYQTSSQLIDLELFIQYPLLWLGNPNFSNFVGDSIFRLKEPKQYDSIKLLKANLVVPKEQNLIINNGESVLHHIHKAVYLYLLNDSSTFNMISSIIDNGTGNWSNILVNSFMIFKNRPKPFFQAKLIESLAPLLSGELFIKLIEEAYFTQRKANPEKGFLFNINRTNDEHYKSLLQYLKNIKVNLDNNDADQEEFIKTLLLIVAEFGTAHPTRFVWSRSELISWQFLKKYQSIHSTSQKAYYNLVKGFRSWIGKTTPLTVDPETGKEYSWKDVITFDQNVRLKHKEHLLEAISKTSLVRESIFLFSKNFLINLNDIPQNGIWITCLGNSESKSIFRLLIKTRSFGTHNLVVNINEGREREFIDEETKWLIVMSSGMNSIPLVENFGGYWPEYNLYTEEYIKDETLDKYLDRNKNDIIDITKIDRWQMRWLHFIWNGIQAYQEFWFRTNYTLSIQPPIPNNLVIPKHDYKTGTHLLSISKRKKIKSISDHFLSLYTDYIIKTEREYPGLRHMSDWEVIFTATLQALKVKEGEKILNSLKGELNQSPIKNKCEKVGLTSERIEQFLKDINAFGVLTKPVVFASLRYERWLDLNPEATNNAKASMLKELYKDYGLDNLLAEYPETRVRFFMMTCFKGENKQLNEQFQLIIKDLRKRELSPWDIQERISDIESIISLSEDEKFFLARMIFPHINSADYVELITTSKGEKSRLNLVYQIECQDEKLYQLRPAFLPKEITSFHTLLAESSLSVTFTNDHEFLFAFNNRNRLAGGLYWKNIDPSRIYLEWVAIRKSYQKIGLSKHLMNDLFKRMKHKNIKTITVGFYAEKFFSKYGFEINKKYSGMVKEL